METFINWFLEFNRFSALAGSLYFIFFIRDKKHTTVLVFIILVCSLLADNLNYFFVRIYSNSFIVSNSWYIANFIVSLILFQHLLKSRKFLISLLITVFFIGSILSFTYFFKLTESNTFIRLFSNSTFIFLSLAFYLELLKKPDGRLRKHPYFWIASSFFIYNSVLLLQSLFKNFLIFDLQISKAAYAWILFISLSANITKNFILFYALVLIDKGYPDTLKPKSAKA
ncbi:hypothetical protein SAMN05421640_0237 [Ekhidna lutea]|uniref:YhhN-like protein n=1 Tax=Ekhidna lutea TaxID=447679 RepID=A0A239EPV1_EKHLU|nr:hypothetical protein SAMN05421640_0237 [Ekhidna lutea]